MLNDENITLPKYYKEIIAASDILGFNMLSDLKTGSLLRTLAAAKAGGHILEIGTGTGLSLAWIAEGADEDTKIISVDNDASCQAVASDIFSEDDRISFVCVDGNDWLINYTGDQFDLIFADAWPGKFENLDKALQLVKPGGFYFIDDLLPQPNWPDGHHEKAERLVTTLLGRTDFYHTVFNWSTGLILFTKIS